MINDPTFPYIPIILVAAAVFFLIFGPLYAVYRVKHGDLAGLYYGLVMAILGFGLFIAGISI